MRNNLLAVMSALSIAAMAPKGRRPRYSTRSTSDHEARAKKKRRRKAARKSRNRNRR